ncbi:unnamed protein product [Gordionus sp. m RMFG-2023]
MHYLSVDKSESAGHAILVTQGKIELVYPEYVTLVKPEVAFIGDGVSADQQQDYEIYKMEDNSRPNIIIPFEKGLREMNIIVDMTDLPESLLQTLNEDYRILKYYFNASRLAHLKQGYISMNDVTGQTYSPVLLDLLGDGKMKAVYKLNQKIYHIEPYQVYMQRNKIKIARTNRLDVKENAHIILQL